MPAKPLRLHLQWHCNFVSIHFITSHLMKHKTQTLARSPILKPKGPPAAQALPCSHLMKHKISAGKAIHSSLMAHALPSSSHNGADADGDASIINIFLGNLEAEGFAANDCAGDEDLHVDECPATPSSSEHVAANLSGADGLPKDKPVNTADFSFTTNLADSTTSNHAQDEDAPTKTSAKADDSHATSVAEHKDSTSPGDATMLQSKLMETTPLPTKAAIKAIKYDVADHGAVTCIANGAATAPVDQLCSANSAAIMNYAANLDEKTHVVANKWAKNDSIILAADDDDAIVTTFLRALLDESSSKLPPTSAILLASHLVCIQLLLASSIITFRMKNNQGETFHYSSSEHNLHFFRIESLLDHITIQFAHILQDTFVFPHTKLILHVAIELLETMLTLFPTTIFEPGGLVDHPFDFYNQFQRSSTLFSTPIHMSHFGFVFSFRLWGRICGYQAHKNTHATESTKSFKVRPKQRSELLKSFIVKSRLDPR